MPFGLVNVGATFQHTMEITFSRLIRYNVVFYLDDVMMFSKKGYDHLCHLKKHFEQCRKYDISLNPKKSNFTISKGNLFGHLIIKIGIKVDPKKFKAITQIPFLVNKKDMQSLVGNIYIMCKFISDYT